MALINNCNYNTSQQVQEADISSRLKYGLMGPRHLGLARFSPGNQTGPVMYGKGVIT